MGSITGRARKHQQMLQSQGALSRQIQDDWDAEEAHQKDEQIAQLQAENQKIREQLNRAKGLARMTLLERDGLVDVVRHLKRTWEAPESERHHKDDIKPLVDDKINEHKNDPEKHEKAKAAIEDILSKPTRKRTGPG